MIFKYFFSALISGICLIYAGSVSAESPSKLSKKLWFSGAKNCETDSKAAIEVFQFNPTSFILRQNKCLHYEAPFMYLLLGKEKSLLLDTGATKNENEFPLAKVVQQIIQEHLSRQNISAKEHSLIVAHSHSHSDHVAGDQQFSGLARTIIIPPNQLRVLQSSLSLNDWPDKVATLDLGGRVITIIPTPGHQSEAISVYDEQTQWLLTGDTFYPGRLYIRDWHEFKDSINRLREFSTQHPISAILGAHIEMSATAKVDYPMGETFQPNEAPLMLHVNDLLLLQQHLTLMGDKPAKVILDKFIIFPLD